jgi:hypothetical protein
VAIGPASLHLAAGTDTVVYAIGSANQKTLSLVTQTVSGLGDPPAGVAAGTGGQAAGIAAAGTATWVWLLLATGGLLMMLGAGGGYARLARTHR